MGEPAPDVFEEDSKLHFAQRFGHKNLKVRIDAFEQLQQTVFLNKLLPPQDPRVEEAVGFIPLGLNDANAVVKDKALGALVSVFNKIKEPENYNKYADVVLPLIISNCLKEQKSFKKCQEACLLFVEYEQGEKVIDNLVVGTQNKTPKIQLNAVKIIAQILSEFGTRAVPWKKILPVTVALSESKYTKIRAHIKEILNSIAKHEGGNAIRQLVYPKFREAFQKDISAILEIQKTNIQVNRITVAATEVCECHCSIDNCRAPFEHQILQCQAPNIYDAIEAMKLSCYELMEVQNSFSNIQTKYKELKAVYKQDIDQAISTLARQAVIFLNTKQQMQQQQAATNYSIQGTSNNNVLIQQNEKYQLSIILKKIGQKETKQQGLEQLYDFLQLHPNISLDNCLTSASKDFKNFVGTALNRIKQQKEKQQQLQINQGASLRRATEEIESLKQQVDQLWQFMSQKNVQKNT